MSHARLLAVVSLSLVATGCPAPSTPPAAPTPTTPSAPAASVAKPQPPGVVEISDDDGDTFQISQSEAGPPAELGCADGQREAFVDFHANPNIAGCIAEWTGTVSMRTPPTDTPCGDDLAPCAAPADACAAGWHLCGIDGSVAEVAAIGADACDSAGGGRFVAAISHCLTQNNCEYGDPATARYTCFPGGWCSEPVCCGNDCEFGSCPGGVWPERTRIAIGTDQGCDAIASSRARGVLCCRDSR